MINSTQFIVDRLPSKMMMEAMPYPIFLGENGTFLYANRTALQLLGLSNLSSLIGRSYFDFVDSSQHSSVRERIKLVAKQIKVEYLKRTVIRADNKVLEVESTAFPLVVEGRVIECMIVRASNEKGEMHHEYLEQKEYYKNLADNSMDTIAIISEFTIVFINKAGLNLLGANHFNEVMGKSIFCFLDEKYHKGVINRARKVLLHKVITTTKQCELKQLNGTVRLIESIEMPVTFNHQPSIQMIIRDITEKKQNEVYMIKSEKLSTAGELSAGIAHEIRNPLTSLKGFLQLMECGHINQTYIQIMKDEIEKIERITGEMLSLSKPQALRFKKENLHLLIKDAITLMEPQALLHNNQIICKFNAKDIFVNCDKAQIKQVLINLVKNGLEAMEQKEMKGKITIECREENGFNILSISDEGCGIPEKLIKKVEEPFFTTKPTGTGLGLMISLNIIKNHGGCILIKSREGIGTEISIKIPSR